MSDVAVNVETVLADFEKKLTIYSPDERIEIISAARWAEGLHHNQKRESGEPYFIHPLKVSEILVNLRLDYKAVMAALLHDVLEDTEITRNELRKEFDKEIETLVNGVTKISSFHVKNKTLQEAETIRKMLFAMTKDIRVILIKLADKLHNMRTLDYLNPERRKRIATECLDIYAPLAGRLGISWVKDELEDLSLKYLRPQIYEQIRKYVSDRKGERADYLERVKRAILEASVKENIKIEVKTRAKHFYSIYQKQKKQGKPLEEIYDLLGIRVFCNTPVECYSLLGIVHRLWKPKAGRFKDYIAMPKSNRYQSLHTTVVCYEGKLIEIQIRTIEMHQTAENGIAAHWLYKKGMTNEIVSIQDLSIINKLKSWDTQKINSQDFLEEIKHELLKDLMYVFTPKGDVIELPAGATAIDFAFHIHSEVGNHCTGAKADGHIIPLKKPLKNGQVVEIITSPSARPHINWLQFAKTPRTRSKIRHWLNQNDAELFIDQKIIARRKTEEVGHGELHSFHKRKKSTGEPDKPVDPTNAAVTVEEEKNVLIRFAKCCNPVLGDPVIGYISRGRGVIVHKEDCRNLQFIKEIEKRLVHVEWETGNTRIVRQIKITANKGTDLFSIMETVMRRYQSKLIAGNLLDTTQDHLTGIFTIELEHREDFRKIIKKLRTLTFITSVHAKTAVNKGGGGITP